MLPNRRLRLKPHRREERDVTVSTKILALPLHTLGVLVCQTTTRGRVPWVICGAVTGPAARMQTAIDTPPADTALSFYIGAVFCADSTTGDNAQPLPPPPGSLVGGAVGTPPGAEQDGDESITPAASSSLIGARLSEYFQPSADSGGGSSVEEDNDDSTMLFDETVDENALLPDPADKASTFSSAHCLASHSRWGAG